MYKKKGERLFAIRTFLWGKYTTEATNKWPVIESGDHRIPFVCELPMVNYPPSFSHDLASCEFELVATIERPGYRPLQTPSLSIRYEPYVAISEPLTPYYETATVSPDIKAILTLPSGCGIHLLDPDASQFQFYLDIKSENHTLNGLEATIVRKMEVKYGSRRRKDTMVMCHSGHLSNRHVVLNLPTKLNQHKIQLSSKSFSFLGMTTSLSFSRFITLEYQLVVTCKVKQGLISTKKQLFCVPLSVGTLPPGEQVPSTISYYRDPHVTSDSTLLTKPKFLKAIPQEEQLPAYTAEGSPPIYVCKNF